ADEEMAGLEEAEISDEKILQMANAVAMSETTQPSAPAMKAARAMISSHLITSSYESPYSMKNKSDKDMFEKMVAQIIDRETGIGELMEALKEAGDDLIPIMDSWNRAEEFSDESYNTLKAAIETAEGGAA